MQIFHLVGRIDLLLKEISEISFQPTSTDSRYLIMFIKAVVNKHRKIIKLHDKIETIYSYICLTQFFASITVLCLAGFLIITVSRIKKMN